ncbi:unnamed protein product [Trichogramma brassicae]|uniref:Uncharacterized protein n=1 Tax=Trichogramma brassicae TaxID=86971 RepID=A0A6H5INH0_9HYME|nr:unnamed protein product [Trichogramma brassicae]
MSLLPVFGRSWDSRVKGRPLAAAGRELDRSPGVGPELRRARQRLQADRHQRHEQQTGAARVQRARAARPAARVLRFQFRCKKKQLIQRLKLGEHWHI